MIGNRHCEVPGPSPRTKRTGICVLIGIRYTDRDSFGLHYLLLRITSMWNPFIKQAIGYRYKLVS